MSDFFAATGGLTLPAAFPEFLQKNKPCKDAPPDDATWKKPLLPQIKCSTKYVKLQVSIYIYSISYFPSNATAKPQNLPATAHSRFCLTGSAAGKYRGKHNCYSAGQKEAPLLRHLRLQSKNFGLQGLFPSACSMHAFISVASVLKSFFRTVSTSPTLCRPSFR